MELIELAVLLSALFCSLVAGLVYTFAIIVMPGIRNLGDLAFLQSFKEMDRVIQNNQPAFVSVWIGSVLLMLVSTVLGFWQLEGVDRALMIVTCVIYVAGVQVPTITINVPLNNYLQSLDLETMPADELLELKALFEDRWIRWNAIRTVLAILTTVLLLVLLVRL